MEAMGSVEFCGVGALQEFFGEGMMQMFIERPSAENCGEGWDRNARRDWTVRWGRCGRGVG